MGKNKEIKVFPDPDKMTNERGLLDSSLRINLGRTRVIKGKQRSKAPIFKKCNHLGETRGCWEVVCVVGSWSGGESWCILGRKVLVQSCGSTYVMFMFLLCISRKAPLHPH